MEEEDRVGKEKSNDAEKINELKLKARDDSLKNSVPWLSTLRIQIWLQMKKPER